MNFYNQFVDLWTARFPIDNKPPHMDCLKADQFSSLLEQKRALEEQSLRICSMVDDLKQKLDQETFTHEYLLKCIQKLGAVSLVFSEIDQSDSKSSSSSCATSRNACSSASPSETPNNNMFSQTPGPVLNNSGPNFSLLPQCIASTLIHSASPLLAAVATSSAPFLFPSSLASFPCPDTIKPEPDSGSHSGGRMPISSCHNLLSNHERHPSGMSDSSSRYGHSFNSGTDFPAPLTPNNSSYDVGNPITPDHGRMGDDLSNSTPDAQAAAAAVAAAFGFNFSSVPPKGPLNNSHGMTNYGKHRFTPDGGLMPITPLSTINGLDCKDMDGSVDRPFQCPTCSRSFAVKAGLVQHMRTHTDERPYPCVHCGRAFKQKIQLTTHMRVHSGERPYGCRLCGKLFRQQSHVVQHLRTHTGEKPHKCYQCGKAFRQKYSLISHQRRMCRNRSASNPIAAGMTMWISPGAGGDTGNLVKEFSPAKCNLSIASPTASLSTPVSVTTSLHSPCSPCPSSPVSNTPTHLPQSQYPNPSIGVNGDSHFDGPLMTTRSRCGSVPISRPVETQDNHHTNTLLSNSSNHFNSDDDLIRSPRSSASRILTAQHQPV